MNSRLLLKLLSISLIALILFSCGTSSNGIFEKRKHLKGWHFKKNNINLSNVSVKKSERNLKIAQNPSSQEIADKSDTENSIGYLPNSLPVNTYRNSELDIHENKEDTAFFISGESSEEEFTIDNKAKYKTLANQDFIIGNALKEQNNKIEYERQLSPFQIFFSMFIMLALFAAALALILSAAIFLEFLGFGIAGGIIGTLGVYLIVSIIVYNIAKLFRRKDGKEILTLKQSFIWVGIFLGSIGISLLLFDYFYDM